MAEIHDTVRANPDAFITLVNLVHPLDVEHVNLAAEDALLNNVGATITFMGLVKSGEYRRMRGFARKVEDPDTHELYLLARTEIID